MKVLIACDKFKGSLSAQEACEAVQHGLPESWQPSLCPIADGGEGFVDALLAVTEGEKIAVNCHDALGREIVAEYALLSDGERTAVIEMSAASGLWRIEEEMWDVLQSNTYGVGELIRHAVIESGANRILIGIGGSATNDGGVGMATALGVGFFNEAGQSVSPVPRDFYKIVKVDRSECIDLPSITVACDVTNPLLGERGASAVFGPQKGAAVEDISKLEEALAALVDVTGGREDADLPGAGAAGGLGFGLRHFAGAEMVGGFDLVAEALGLRERVKGSDLVITGEGSLDAQTLDGKGPAGIASLARELSVPVIGIGGRVTAEAEPLFDQTFSLDSTGLPLATLMRDASELLTKLVREEFRDGLE